MSEKTETVSLAGPALPLEFDDAFIKQLLRALCNAPDSDLAWLGRRIRQAEAREKARKESGE